MEPFFKKVPKNPLCQTQKLFGVSADELVIIFFADLPVFPKTCEKGVEFEGEGGAGHTDVTAVEKAIGKFLDEAGGKIPIPHECIGARACGEVAVEIAVLAQELGETTLGDLALWVAVAGLDGIFGGNFRPEGRGMSDKLEVMMFFDHALQAGQAELVDDAVCAAVLGRDVEEHGELAGFTVGEEIVHHGRVGVEG